MKPGPDGLWYRGRPIVVETRNGRGRCLAANRSLKAGETVLEASPYAWAPADPCYERVCQHCGRDKLDAGAPCQFYCDACYRAWYCSELCRELDCPQHQIECSALDRGLRSSAWQSPDSRDELRLLLRLLSRRVLESGDGASGPGSNQLHAGRSPECPLGFDDFLLLASNRNAYGDEFLRQLRTVADSVRSLDGWLTAVESEVIVECLLRTRTNSFAITNTSGVCVGLGIYLQASLLNHSCEASVICRRVAGSLDLAFSVVGSIPARGELTLSYVAQGTLAERRAWLLQNHYFVCDCARCRIDESGEAQREPGPVESNQKAS